MRPPLAVSGVNFSTGCEPAFAHYSTPEVAGAGPTTPLRRAPERLLYLNRACLYAICLEHRFWPWAPTIWVRIHHVCRAIWPDRLVLADRQDTPVQGAAGVGAETCTFECAVAATLEPASLRPTEVVATTQSVWRRLRGLGLTNTLAMLSIGAGERLTAANLAGPEPPQRTSAVQRLRAAELGGQCNLRRPGYTLAS